ncbi:MAG: hypothetical protein E7600_02645 [Ruminococcaceae bacterium]|nr:hypothetical protein [Oscillospiraceae bacterium]
MRKFLSVLLALMMVVSTVSFAVPSAVTTDDSATNAVAEDATQATTEEMAELTAESDYGTLVYSVDFERSDFNVAKFSEAYAMLASNPIAAYLNPDFNYSNVTTYTNAAGDGFSNAALVTENGNTYITGNVAAGYDGFFRMTKYSMTWPDGIYTFSVDVKIPAGQAANWAAQCNDTALELVAVAPFNTASGDWQTVVFQTKNVVRGSNSGSTDTEGFYGFFMTPNNATAGTVAYDNWKVYYKAPTATVTIDPNGRAGKTAVDVEGLTANSNVSVATLLTKAQEMDSDVIGLATEPAGAVINTSTHYVEYYDRLYAVYGYDINVMANGNSDVQNMVIEDIDTRTPYTVGQVVAEFKSTAVTDKVLRGISDTPKGEPLAESTVINTAKTLYAIWESDGSEYGTLLASIDFEDIAAGTVLTDNAKVELVDPDALTNGEFLINWQVGGNTVAQEANGNKYVRGGQGWAQFIFNNPKYNDANAPMPEGKYTILANVIDFGTTKRSISTTCQKYNNVTATTPNSLLDSFTGENNKWDLVVGQWNGSSNDMTIYFTDGATTDVGFDNIKLYFEPASNAVFSITVDPNGRSGVSSKVAKVNNGSTITAGELASLMPGCAGVSLTVDGEVLPSDYIISPDYNKTVYAVWEYEESEFGTLLLDIDFERENIPVPNKLLNAVDIATNWNKDLVYGKVYFNIGSTASAGALNGASLVTENGNTYFRGDAAAGYNFINVLEYQDGIEWLNGTYTYVMDIKTSAGLTTFAGHVNNYGTNVTTLDEARRNDPGKWDRIAIQYNGAISSVSNTGSIYIAPNVTGGTIEIDNIKLFYKTDETVITLKPNGNKDLSDIEVPVSTSTGITVAELIAEVNKFETTHTLLGIAETATGELLDVNTRITPKYQKSLYLIWKTKSSNPMIDDYLGKLIYLVDFEREDVINSGWNGFCEVDGSNYGHGARAKNVATLYDPLVAEHNFRITFPIDDNQDGVVEGVSIKTDTEGNHFLEGKNTTRWPQAGITSYETDGEKLSYGNGIYTFFVRAMSEGAAGSSFAPTGVSNYKLIDGDADKNGVWDYVPGEWGEYSYSFEITDGSVVPQARAYFSHTGTGHTVAFDDLKLYYKPFTATITLNPGTLEGFGTYTVENISTTGENTGNDLVAAIQGKLDVAGVEFVGLMDEYGDMIDLSKPLVIPGDVTYTIIWGEANPIAPVTQEKNSIRQSIKPESRGIRFVANIDKTVVGIYTDNVTEYGWIITRPELLEEAGVSPYAFTKETVLRKPVIVGKNYGFQNTGDKDADRKHFDEDDETLIITAVVYGLKPANYKGELLVRPYIVVDGVTYYGKPWQRSMYDTAVALREAGYPDCDDTTKAYVDEIINNAI